MSNLNSAIETNVSNITAARRQRTGGARISRQRWMRIMAVLAGVMLLVMQAVPVLAAGSSMSRSALDNLDYRLGKEETSYGLFGGAQFAPVSSSLALLDPQVSISFAAPDAASASSAGRIDILEDALGKLEESEQPADAEEAGQTDEIDEQEQDDDATDEDRGDSTSEDDPADDPADERPAGGDRDEMPDSESELSQSDSLVVTDEFTSGTDTVLWTGEHQGNEGFISEEDGGWYVMLIQPGTTFPLIATGQMTITDGAIVTGASFGGDGVGEVGLIGRSAIDYSAYYYCEVDSDGGAGCWYYDGAQWYGLFYLPPGEVTRYEVDLLDMEIYGDTLTFYVNDTLVGSISDAGIDGGSWGVATACFEGSCAGSFDFVDVYDYGTTADSDTGLTTVLASDMTENNLGLYAEEGEWGYAGFDDGWYIVSMAPGWYFPNAIAGTENLSDGVITMDAAFDGYGAIGLVTRMSTNADGYASYYVCWLVSDGYAGCNVVVDEEWYAIEGAESFEVSVEEINQLTMGTFGDEITFAVNGQQLVDAFDGTLTSGAMGFYHDAFADASENFYSYIDSVTVQTVGTDETVDGDYQTVFASDMTENDLGLYVDQGEWGATSFIDGWYATELASGWWFPNTIAGTDSVQDGYMTAVVALDGIGSTGLVARTQYGDAGLSYYVCWISYDAYAGCHVVVDGEWYQLAVTEQPIALQDVNEISLGMFGAEIYFMVNGELVVQAYDETLASGDWGFFTEAFDGEGVVSYVDFVALDQYIGS